MLGWQAVGRAGQAGQGCHDGALQGLASTARQLAQQVVASPPLQLLGSCLRDMLTSGLRPHAWCAVTRACKKQQLRSLA